MSPNRGPNSERQLKAGRVRKLSTSELERGNMFISSSVDRINFIDNHIIIIFDGHEFPKSRVDDYGRIFIGRDFLENYKNKLLELKLISRSTLVVKVIR